MGSNNYEFSEAYSHHCQSILYTHLLNLGNYKTKQNKKKKSAQRKNESKKKKKIVKEINIFFKKR